MFSELCREVKSKQTQKKHLSEGNFSRKKVLPPSPQRKQGKREVNWKKKVVAITWGSTKTEMKLSEVMNTREGADRTESGCGHVKKS